MEQGNDSVQGILKSIDWITILIYLLLVTMGWFCIMGATYSLGEPISLDFDTRAGKQLLWIGLSVILGFAILLSNNKIYDTLANLVYLLMMAILVITPFIATNHKGSLSWITMGPVSLQPAEFAKTATAMALARLMGIYSFKLSNPRHMARAIAIVLLPMLLIIMQKETGSALVYFAFFLMFYREGMSGSVLFVGMAAVVYFVVGLRYDHIEMPGAPLISIGSFSVLTLVWLFTSCFTLAYSPQKSHVKYMFFTGLGSIGLAWLISNYIISFNISIVLLLVNIGCILYTVIIALSIRKPRFLLIALFTVCSLAMFYSTNYVMNHILEPHQQTRINVLLGLEEDINGAGYNVRQSEIAIGSGGLTGKGFLNGTQTKLKYVPEQETDFIFCTVGEEFGFRGSAIVLILFLLLILRLQQLAERQESVSARVFGYCVLSIFLFHIFINIGMVIGLTPVIGIPLPFFSYGGSSLWGFTILLFIFLRIDAARNKKV